MKWPMVQLGDVARVESGFGFPRECQGDKTGSVPFLKVSDMNLPGNSVEVTEWSNAVTSGVLKKLRAHSFPAGTIIFPKLGAAIATGKKRILTCEATFDNNIMGLIPKKIDARFLYYWTLTFDFTSISNIGPVPSIRKSTVEKLELPLPPPPEQRHIAEILDQADTLRKMRAEADAKADRILPALFYRMFGDPVRNEKGWEQVALTDIVEVKGGKRLPKGVPYSPVRTPFRYIRGTDIVRNAILADQLVYLTPETQAQIARYTVDAGDVVITIAGKIGVCAPIDESVAEANLTENAAKLVPMGRKRRYHPVYLSAFLNLPYAQSQIAALCGTVTIGKLALFRIGTIKVVLPPLDMQVEFAARVQHLRVLMDRQKTAGDEVGKLFDSLLHRAFKGEL